MTYRLSDAAVKAKSKETWIVPGGQHNTTFMQAGALYPTKLREFMNKCTAEIKKEVKAEAKEIKEAFQEDNEEKELEK